jgi:hypothetical protein
MPRIHRENKVVSTATKLFSEDDGCERDSKSFLEMALRLAITATNDNSSSSNDRSQKPPTYDNTTTAATIRNKRIPKMSSFPMPRLKQQRHVKYHPYSLQSYESMWRTIRTTTVGDKRELFMRKIQRGFHHRR